MRKSIRKILPQRHMRSNSIMSVGQPTSSLPRYTDNSQVHIAIVQPACFGDCINSTLMLRPLHAHYPGAIIDVYTSTLYRTAFDNNPYITNIITYAANAKEEALHLLHVIPPEIADSGYTTVFVPHPMVNPANWTSIRHPELGSNLICAWVRALEHAGIPYEMPLETILRLTPGEVATADAFWNNLPTSGVRNILLETHGESGQTFWNPDWTVAVCRYLLDGHTNVFLSRKFDSSDFNSIRQFANGRAWFVGHLSIRECVELYNRCDAFFSISSGLCNACNSSWGRTDVRWIEAINSPDVASAPIRTENKIFWYANDLPAFLNMLRENGI